MADQQRQCVGGAFRGAGAFLQLGTQPPHPAQQRLEAFAGPPLARVVEFLGRQP